MRWTPADTWALRDDMLAVLTREPKQFLEIWTTLQDSWGSINERTAWRVLQWLISRGKAERVGTPRSSGDRSPSGYRRTKHGGCETEKDRRERKLLQLRDRRRCRDCEAKRGLDRIGRCIQCRRIEGRRRDKAYRTRRKLHAHEWTTRAGLPGFICACGRSGAMYPDGHIRAHRLRRADAAPAP